MKLGKRSRRALVIAALAMVAAWTIFAIAVRWRTYPKELLDRAGAASLTVTDASGRVLRQTATAGGGRETWVPLGSISPHLIHATIAAEDRRFWAHGGVDFFGILRAVWLDLKGLRMAYGGSTLTMQLVRTIEPPDHGGRRTLGDKVRETILASRLERVASKSEILEQYLNRVYYGNGAWGAEAAARLYFGKPASALSLGEAAFLSVLPRGPRVYDPYKKLAAAEKRRSHVLELMHNDRYITDEERMLAERTPLALSREHPDFRAPHFVDYVRGQLAPEERKGGTVTTTLDMTLQERVEVAVAEHLDSIGQHVGQAAVVVLRNSDGAILAMVGSRDYFDADHDGAANAVIIRRRPGSTLKPFVYALAMERGDTPATLSYDVVLAGESRESYTADVKQHGPARYREALAGSYNLSAVHTLKRVGVPALVSRLRRAGIATLDRDDRAYGPALAVGEAEVRLLDLAAAYAAFGNEGRPVVPYAVRSVALPGLSPASRASRSASRVFSPEIAHLVFDILSDPDARRPMFGSQVPMELPFPVALKTGTTRAYTDNLAFGVTREYTVGAWAGNFDGSPTDRVMAMHGAAPLVRAAFVALAARYGAPTAPARPASITTADVCPISGLRPGPACPTRKRERFLAGTEPTDTCDWHHEIGGHIEVVYPREVAGWVRAREHRVAPATGFGIVSPSPGAHFLLDPGRPLAHQIPPLEASPFDRAADIRWTIDDAPAGSFVPSAGTHRIRAEWQGAHDEVEVVFD
jgi:penicillin-binding protein 1C